MGNSMFLLFAIALNSAMPDANQAATTTQAPAAAPAKKEKKVCKVDEASSGSRMPHRVCMTQSEWDGHAQGMSNSAHSGYSGSAEDH